MTGYETILAAALTRLQAAPSIATTIRRAHRTAVPRANAPAIHVIDGPDRRVSSPCRRQCEFTVSVFARSDEGVSATDTLRIAVAARMDAAWPSGISVVAGPITPDTEIGDEDPVRLDFEFTATYPIAGPDSLELP